MSGKLLLRSDPGNEETPLSYMSRLARLNNKGVRQFCSDLGIKLQSLVDGRQETITSLAHLAGTDPRPLLDAAMTRTGRRHYAWRGEKIGVSDLSRLRLRACPRCLAQDVRASADGVGAPPHGRAAWLVRHLRTCPEHRCSLVELQSSYATMHDFAGTVALTPGLLDPDYPIVETVSSDFEAYLLGRLEGSGNPDTPLLNRIPFTAAAATCGAMGSVIAFGRRAHVSQLDGVALHLACELGFEVMRHGPDGIRELLTAWDAGHADDGAPGSRPANLYGSFRTFLFGRHRRSDLDPVRDVVVDHIVRTTPVDAGDVVHGRTVEQRLVHSLATASKETGVPVLTLRRILREAGVIDAEADRREARTVLFDAVANRRLLGRVARSITLRKVAAQLRVGIHKVRHLVDAGLIPAAFAGGGAGARLFDAADVDRLLRRLRDHARAVRSDPPGTCGVVLAATRAHCGLATIVTLILDGAVAWVGHREDVDGLPAIRVRVSEVKRLTGRGGSDLLTPPEVGEEVGLTCKQTSLLITSGMITARRLGSPGRGHPRLVTRTEALRFRSLYVTLGQIGRDWGMHPNRCRRLLSEGGVQPAFSSADPHISVYLRVSVARVSARVMDVSEQPLGTRTSR